MLVRSYRSAFILLFTALLVLTTAAVAFNAYRWVAEVSLGLSEDIIDQMADKVMGWSPCPSWSSSCPSNCRP